MSFSVCFKSLGMSPRKVLLREGIAKESGAENTHISECLHRAVFTLLTLPAERM